MPTKRDETEKIENEMPRDVRESTRFATCRRCRNRESRIRIRRVLSDTYLNHESAGFETRFGAGQNPGWDKAAAEQASKDHGPSPSDPLRHVAPNRTTDARSYLHDDTGPGSSGVVEFLSGEHEGGVAVLRAVREPVEPAHQNDGEDANLPLLTKHGAKALAEVLGARALAGFASLDELLGFGPRETQETNSKAKASSDPEHDGPSVDGSTDTQVDTSSEHVANE